MLGIAENPVKGVQRAAYDHRLRQNGEQRHADTNTEDQPELAFSSAHLHSSAPRPA